MAAYSVTHKDINAIAGRDEWSVIGWLERSITRMVDAYLEHRRYHATVKALGDLNQRLLTDIGVERAQIELVAQQVAKHGRRLR